MYLSQIQRGIQSAHAIAEMHNLLMDKTAPIYDEWVNNHKTMIVLNGGSCGSLKEISQLQRRVEKHSNSLPIPFGSFYEDSSLNNALTAVAMILPDMVYKKFEKDTEWAGNMRDLMYLMENRILLATETAYSEDVIRLCVDIHNTIHSCKLA